MQRQHWGQRPSVLLQLGPCVAAGNQVVKPLGHGAAARRPGLCRAVAPRRFACHPRGGDRHCRPQQEDEEPGQAHCAAHGCLAAAKADCPHAPNAWDGRSQFCLPPGRCSSGQGLRQRPSSQPTPMIRTSCPFSLWPTHPRPPRLPAARLGLARLIPSMTHTPAEGGRAGTASSPSLALQRLWPSRAKFSISCVSAGRAGQPVASGAFAPQCGPAKHSSGDCPRGPAPRTRSCQSKDSPEPGTRPGPPPAETDSPQRSRV